MQESSRHGNLDEMLQESMRCTIVCFLLREREVVGACRRHIRWLAVGVGRGLRSGPRLCCACWLTPLPRPLPRDSIGQKRREAEAKEGGAAAKKKRRRADSDDEYAGGWWAGV